jgi:glucose/mannose transport system substrate-binding protein
MRRAPTTATALLWGLVATAPAGAATAPVAPVGPPLRAEVLHWWTSGGEGAAVRTLAGAYRARGGVWIDTAIAGAEQARAVAITRIAGGRPPTAVLFNASRQFQDLVEQGQLTSVDDVAQRGGWDRLLPPAILDVVRVRGHYWAAPVSLHMPAWLWYSKSAFRKAGITREPASFEELFAALDRLRAAGLIPLAHGGQPWQDSLVFRAVLASQGGRELYLKVFRDRDAAALRSPEFRRVLETFKRLHDYVDPGAVGRNWNDATALVISGRAGVQIMGDWVKAEFATAGQQAGRDYGCLPTLGAAAPVILQGDVLVFPRGRDRDAERAQALLAEVVTSASAQAAFATRKGSIPVRADVESPAADPCSRLAATLVRERTRLVPNDEIFLTPEQNGAMADVLTTYWHRSVPVATVQEKILAALQD